jgi:hypothetical protein
LLLTGRDLLSESVSLVDPLLLVVGQNEEGSEGGGVLNLLHVLPGKLGERWEDRSRRRCRGGRLNLTGVEPPLNLSLDTGVQLLLGVGGRSGRLVVTEDRTTGRNRRGFVWLVLRLGGLLILNRLISLFVIREKVVNDILNYRLGFIGEQGGNVAVLTHRVEEPVQHRLGDFTAASVGERESGGRHY